MVNVIAELITTTFWKWLIMNVLAFIDNYGWRVIFLTVVIKLILSPLDFFNRKKAKDNAAIMQKMKPELEKLQKQYAKNPTELQRHRSALNKKYGYSMFSSCLAMLVPLIIFVTLISGYTGTAKVLNTKTYESLFNEYTTYYYSATGTNAVELDTQKLAEINQRNDEWYNFQIDIIKNSKNTDKTAEELHTLLEEELGYKVAVGDNLYTTDTIKTLPLRNQYEEVCKYISQEKVYQLYVDKEDEPFLWIKNIWRPDTWQNPIYSQKEFYALTGMKQNAEIDYNDVMGRIQYEYSGMWNGFLILVILSVGLNFLNTWISTKQQKATADPTQANMMGSMKMMVFIMPIIIGFFALTQTSAFTLYMAVNSVMTLIINLISTGIIKLIDSKKEENASPYTRKIIK